MSEIEINKKEFYTQPFEIENKGMKDTIKIQECVNQFINLLSETNYITNAGIWIFYKDKKIFLNKNRDTPPTDAIVESTPMFLDPEQKKQVFKVYMFVE